VAVLEPWLLAVTLEVRLRPLVETGGLLMVEADERRRSSLWDVRY